MFEKIHYELLKKSKNLKFLNSQILENGVQKINNQQLDFFSFFIRTIISQQISFKVANKIWYNINEFFKNEKISPFEYFDKTPQKKILNELPLSRLKINYIINLTKALKKKEIEEEELRKLSDENFSKTLTKIYGVGSWTCNMFLIFFYKRLNIWPKNDLIIDKVKNYINNAESKNLDFEVLFSPYLSILALHFWEINSRCLSKKS